MSGKLTDGPGGTIAKAQPPQTAQRFIFDDHRDAPRGFGLRITKAGGKAFILKYSCAGRVRRMTIGQWPTWSLQAARRRAQELVRMVDEGIDPLDQARERADAPTVAELVEMYVDRHVSGLVAAKPVARYFERDLLPALGSMKVADVRRRDIIDVVEQKAEATPTAARHLLVYTKGLFDWAVDREYIEVSPAAGIKPKSITPKGRKNALKPRARQRVLSEAEIEAFWNRAEECGMHRLTALALKLVLVTGQRPGEVAGMSWDEIDGDVWVVSAARRRKTETEQRVPLTDSARAILEAARAEVERLSDRRGQPAGGFVFESRPGRPLEGNALSKAALRHRDDLANEDRPDWGHWTPHDLRRSCRTGLTACGVPEEIAERVIGHKAQGIVDVYNRHDYDREKRAALEAWDRRLQLMAKGADPSSATVLPFRQPA